LCKESVAKILVLLLTGGLLSFTGALAFAQASEWSLLQTGDSPPARRSHSMAYDTENRLIVVFGGYGNGSHLGDTWVLDVDKATWTNLRPENAPSPRAAAAMVYDPENEQMFLFGGFSLGHSIVLNDTWSYDFASNAWTGLKSGNPPSERASYGMVYDSKRQVLVLFGGFTEKGYFNDMWVYESPENSWRELSINGEAPPPRGAMGFVYDDRNDSFIMFGGFSDMGFFSDTWIFDPRTNVWKRVDTADSPPPIRTRMVYDNSTGRAVFFGGDIVSQESEEGSPDLYSKVWSYDPLVENWEEMEVTNGPPARSLNGAIYDPYRHTLIIFGGTDTLIDSENFIGHEFRDTWLLPLNNPKTSEWSPIGIPVGIGAAVAAIIAAVTIMKKRKQGKKA